MTRYVRRYHSTTGAVSYEPLPATNALRPFVTGCGIAGAFGASLLLAGEGGWLDVASFALRGGGLAWLAAAGWEAYDTVRIANHLHRVATGAPPVAENATTRTQSVIVQPTPELLHFEHKQREARHEALRLLTAAANVVGWDGTTIPRYTRLRWGNDRRAKAVASLADHLDVTPGKETRVRVGTLRELHDAVQRGAIRPTLPASGGVGQ